jgi:dihydroxy-acid dehydratase
MLERPVVGIANTGSGFNNCHRHFPELLDAVKRGVLAAGGLPIDFPTVSLGEVFLNPTSLKYRNLMSIDTEEMIRAQPMDAVVLMGGCDKTVPAQLMGAASAGRPAIMLVAGPMMTSRHRGERLGACTDCRRFWARYRAAISTRPRSIRSRQAGDDRRELRGDGTASTMACLAGRSAWHCNSAAIPAVTPTGPRRRGERAPRRADRHRSDACEDHHRGVRRERLACFSPSAARPMR